MNLNEMVCGVEISTVLEDLDLNEKSYFCWRWDGKDFVVEPYVSDEYSKTRAYLVSELLRLLPKKVGEYWMRVEPDDAGWNITYFKENEVLIASTGNGSQSEYPATTGASCDDILVSINDEYLAPCLADCLTWLLRNGYVKVEDLKL